MQRPARCPTSRCWKSPARTRTANCSRVRRRWESQRRAAADHRRARPRRRGRRSGRGERVLARLDQGRRRLRGAHHQAARRQRAQGAGRADRDGRKGCASRRSTARAAPNSSSTSATAAARRTTNWCSPSRSPAAPSGLPRARVVERLGSMDAPKTVSLIAIHAHGIPTEFPERGASTRRTGATPPIRTAAPICAPFRSSPSIPKMRAIMTTRCGPDPTTIRQIPAAISPSSPSPTWRIT